MVTLERDHADEMMRRLHALAFDPNVCGPNEVYAPAVRWAVVEIDRLRSILKRAHIDAGCPTAGEYCRSLVLAAEPPPGMRRPAEWPP